MGSASNCPVDPIDIEDHNWRCHWRQIINSNNKNRRVTGTQRGQHEDDNDVADVDKLAPRMCHYGAYYKLLMPDYWRAGPPDPGGHCGPRAVYISLACAACLCKPKVFHLLLQGPYINCTGCFETKWNFHAGEEGHELMDSRSAGAFISLVMQLGRVYKTQTDKINKRKWKLLKNNIAKKSIS